MRERWRRSVNRRGDERFDLCPDLTSARLPLCEKFLFFVKAAGFAGGARGTVGHAAWRSVPPAPRATSDIGCGALLDDHALAGQRCTR